MKKSEFKALLKEAILELISEGSLPNFVGQASPSQTQQVQEIQNFPFQPHSSQQPIQIVNSSMGNFAGNNMFQEAIHQVEREMQEMQPEQTISSGIPRWAQLAFNSPIKNRPGNGV